MKYKIGDKLKVKKGCEDECVTYCRYSNSDHIVITGNNIDDYMYDIFDKNGNKLNFCHSCFQDEHLDLYTKDITDISKYEVGDILVDDNMNPLTTLISEQNKQMWDIIKEHTVFVSKNDYDLSSITGLIDTKKLSNWHTTSTIQILEAIVGEMEKEIVEGVGNDTSKVESWNVSNIKYIGHNQALETQINNLTAVINSLK
jgi:hypothetical protein